MDKKQQNETGSNLKKRKGQAQLIREGVVIILDINYVYQVALKSSSAVGLCFYFNRFIEINF